MSWTRADDGKFAVAVLGCYWEWEVGPTWAQADDFPVCRCVDKKHTDGVALNLLPYLTAPTWEICGQVIEAMAAECYLRAATIEFDIQTERWFFTIHGNADGGDIVASANALQGAVVEAAAKACGIERGGSNGAD